MPEVRIIAKSRQGKNNEYFGVSDEKGRFFINVPPGKYRAEPLIHKGLSFSESYAKPNVDVEIADLKCEVKTFWVQNDSKIAGKVVDDKGRSVNKVMLHLTHVEKNRGDKGFNDYWSGVYENGEFEFKGIPAGNYYLSLNYAEKPDDEAPYPTTFYPLKHELNEAQIIEISAGTKLTALKFVLPEKLKKLPIKGRVTWKDGQPAARAEIKLIDTEFDRDVFLFEPIAANDSGQFEMEWFAGRKYKLHIIVWQKEPDGSGFGIGDAESAEFILTKDTPEFEIIIDTTDPRKGTSLLAEIGQLSWIKNIWASLRSGF